MIVVGASTAPWLTSATLAQSAVTTIRVGNGPWGVAINPTTNRIYVANFMSNDVSVVDGATNQLLATVPVGFQNRFVAVSSIENRIYVAGSRPGEVAGQLAYIDGQSHNVLGPLQADRSTDVALDPLSGGLYVASATSDLVTVLDSTGRSSIAVGHEPTGLAIDAELRRLYGPITEATTYR